MEKVANICSPFGEHKNKCFVTCCMFIGVKNQQSKSCPSHMGHAYLTWYIECTWIWLRNLFSRVYKKEQSKSCPSCMWHSYLTWYMSLPKIIKLSWTVRELWPAQDFHTRWDKYIMEKERALALLVLIAASTQYNQINSNHIFKNLALKFIRGR